MRKILLVEDEPILRESYQMILSTEPYIVDVVSNGEEALTMLHKTTYDLVLLDLMMPVTDGVGFLERLDKDCLDNTKIIVMSNLSSGNELSKAMKLGAYKSVVKADLSPKQLISMVRYEVGGI